jgi:hypothetical protein
VAKSAYEYVKAWRKRPENRHKRAEEARRWRAKNPEVLAAIKARFRKKHLCRIRKEDRERAAEYRKTLEYKEKQRIRVARFKERQRERQCEIAGRPKPKLCEICKTDEFPIVFDHCHEQGHFRGWICDRCNKTLGLVRDNHGLLLAMASYLKETGSWLF